MGFPFGFGRRTWIQKGSKFGFSGFGPRLGPFPAKHVQISGFLEVFEWVRSSGLVDKPLNE